MKYTLVVFSSRQDTMTYYKIIKNFGLFCSIVNTPRKLSSSCGISCKIDARLISNSLNIIKTNHLHSFKGIFSIQITANKEIVQQLV